MSVVAVLMCVSLGFIISNQRFTRDDLLAVALYAGLGIFAWRPYAAAFTVMAISAVGVVFTGSGGDLLELSIALSLVAATCTLWVVSTHCLLVAGLTAYLSVSWSTLADGGIFGIAGIATIAFLVGLAFRLVAAREALLVEDRSRLASALEALAHEERERIADELHDGIAHDLTLVLFHARALPRQPDDAARDVSLKTIEASSEQALHSIQSLLSLMRATASPSAEMPAVRYDGGVVEAVVSLADLLADAGIPTRVDVPDAPLEAASTAGRLLTEISVEAVTNILKHSPNSRTAFIALRQHSDVVELIVENDASVTPRSLVTAGPGRGMSRAEQRLRSVHGQLESTPTEHGWCLRATVPTLTTPHARRNGP